MSRRRQGDEYRARHSLNEGVYRTFRKIEWMCASCEDRTGHQRRVGRIVRQGGYDMLEHTLTRLDGPNGETKVTATCSACRAQDVATAPQVRWDRLSAILDEMERTGEYRRSFTPR